MQSKRIVDAVFVDRSGRRRRLITVAGFLGGLALALVALAFVAGFTGAGPAVVPGWPEAATGADHGRAPQRTVTTARPRPSATATVAPRPRTADPDPEAAGAPTTSAPTTSAPASATPAPSADASPTPRNNGRRPSHTPNPRSARNR